MLFFLHVFLVRVDDDDESLSDDAIVDVSAVIGFLVLFLVLVDRIDNVNKAKRLTSTIG